jgi:medium-chain acyl-[acyl-carrier-protein] hydrolase
MRMSSKEPSATRWINGIVAPAETGAVRLFCFPHAGGGASVFRSWMPQLAPGIEVYPIQLPGREGRWLEPRVARASDLIQTLIEEVGFLFHPPFAFFGHSMGALIAFELARELRRSGGPQPDILIVSGARAPHVADPDPPMHQLPDDLLLEDLKLLDGIPAELLEEPEIVSMMLPTLRADLTMCETYEYRNEQPLDCSISVYGGDSDRKIHLEHLSPWEIHTARGFQLRMFPGNHFFFIRDSRATVREALCEDLRPHIKQAKQVNPAARHVQLEQLIARVWADLLRLPQVGIDDNFFDLGADSLLVIQAHGKLQEASISSLSVLDLFQYPTVRLLASAVGDSPTGFGNKREILP